MILFDESGREQDPIEYQRSLQEPDARKRPMLLLEPTRHLMVQQASLDGGYRLNTIGFYVYMPTYSDPNVATYRKIDGTEWVMGIRGTSSAADVAVDVKHFLGIGIGHTVRYLSALALAQQVREVAVKEGARVCLTGHSLGGLVAAKINYQLFKGACQTVVYSPAAQIFDSDTWKVYGCNDTYVIAKPDDMVSMGAFLAHPHRCFLSEGEYLHALGSALYISHNPFADMDPTDAVMDSGAITSLIQSGKNMVVQNISERIGKLSSVGVDIGLTALVHYNANPSQGIGSALDVAVMQVGAAALSGAAMELLIGQLIEIAVTTALEAIGLATAPFGGVILTAIAAGVEAALTTGFLTLFQRAFQFEVPPPPHIVLTPPGDMHFTTYFTDGIKPY